MVIKLFFNGIFVLTITLLLFVFQTSTIVYAQDDLGGSTGGSDLGKDNNTPSGDWADYSGNDIGGSNDNSFDNYTDYSGGDSNSSFEDYVNEAIGLGQEAGTISGPGMTAPLSNQNHTLDQNGVTASYDPQDDPCLGVGTCPYPAPVLSATASCVGSQPVVDLSLSGIPTPTSANGWLGSTTFLIRSPQLQTAASANGTMRIFPYAALSYGTFGYRDTYREYWSQGYSTPGWTEVTSTDENGNPTGYIEHPGTYTPPALVLTQNVSPYSFYYYRIYSTNASGVVYYTSTVSGFSLNYTYTARTPVSNIVAVYTPGCGITPPAPVVVPTPTPTPTPTPIPTPTPSASLALVSNNCTSGRTSSATFSFSSPTSGVQAYHLDKNGTYIGTASPNNPTLQVSLGAGESANFTVRVQVASGTYGGSNTVTVRADDCVPTVRPVVNVTLTTPNGTFPYGGLPVSVKQGDPVTISWQVEFADWATASSNPNKAEWTGGKDRTSGTQAISTTDAANFILGLDAGNVVGTTSVSMQLNVRRLTPFIQTTGGDVHTNESIFITPD